ncbi:hypothetical protein CARUB_v10006282mg [Capsella rubella]|uniref:F-box associated beta-propeller type 1 domain-containing protein n=1 Tax=Capsella rubella TaxID=81985 RepID=R0H2Z0_9BRAS|nr:F-box protein At5g49610 [Capsella rubella]EOA17873.1 hypothetical protein CARUB_v10006282mg [Capsella rubella]
MAKDNSPTMVMVEDVMLEIMSYCPASEMAKLRQLNKEYNRRSYELSFIKRQLDRTNSFFGYIFHYRDQKFRSRSSFVSAFNGEEKIPISLAFLPPRHNNVAIKACDTHHGILLCVDDNVYKGGRRIPDYIVCKPATKQYRIIPNPKTRWFTVATGLMVVSSNPFRYKIIRVSDTNAKVSKNGVDSLSCEVYDSVSDAWKRLPNMETDEFFPGDVKPVSAYGCLHWLTENNNVMRFCMRTETWSIFPVPNELVGDSCLMLVSYEGKLGVIHSRWGEGSDIWVLEKSFATSWVRLEDAKVKALGGDDIFKAQPIWFPSNDSVSRSSSSSLGLYNMNNDIYSYLYRMQDFYHMYCPAMKYFVPFHSNYERVCLNRDGE